jgi:hypothetical protein
MDMMNEQIEKLISRSFTDEQGEQFNIEKFAELIVRECAEVVSNQYSEDWGKWSNKMILEHFGVKE